MSLKLSIFIFFLVGMQSQFVNAQDMSTTPQSTYHAPPTSSLEDLNKSIWDNFYTGGGLSLQFGSVTLIGASPLLAYKFTDALSVGVRVTYQYANQSQTSLSQTMLGGAIFARYQIAQGLFAHVENESLSFKTTLGSNFSSRSKTANSTFVGGGYQYPISDGIFINMFLLYNVTYNQTTSPYYSPWVTRGGLSVNL